MNNSMEIRKNKSTEITLIITNQLVIKSIYNAIEIIRRLNKEYTNITIIKDRLANKFQIFIESEISKKETNQKLNKDLYYYIPPDTPSVNINFYHHSNKIKLSIYTNTFYSQLRLFVSKIKNPS